MEQDNKSSPVSGNETKGILINDINYNITLLERGVNAIESRFISRVLRSLSSIRRQLDVKLLSELVQTFLHPSLPSYPFLTHTIESIQTQMTADATKAAEVQKKVLPEIELYFGLLIQLYLLDIKEYDLGVKLSTQLIDYIHNTNRRTSDLLASKIYFYTCRFYELKGELNQFHPNLLNIYRTATLRRDNECQATLINLLLRSYFNNKQYEQAEKLISKSNFPENVSNNQFVRYMYYLGRINAIQLDYSSAHTHLLQAIRKAPQTAASAGFLQTCNKLLIIVQLLMGELPERAVFRQPMLKKPLVPYLGITQAVRIGDLNLFQTNLAEHSQKFQSDNNFTLILRLRHNVIKTGIRMISLSYSKISLREICFKLGLDSEQNVEYIVAKAIRDGVINATINHEQGYIQSKEHVDIYSTNEPQSAFHQRISFCLSLHNDSVKAMRFPMNAHRKELETAEEAREREKELVKEISEADIDDEDEGDF